MIENTIKEEIQCAFRGLYQAHVKTDDINIEVPAQKNNGDFSSNIAFLKSRELSKNPIEIAKSLATELSKKEIFREVRSVGGFLNFFIKSEALTPIVPVINQLGKKFGDSKLYLGQKVQLEFISANPTGPLTLANGRGGFGGDVLANLFQKAGAEVQREYYVNDGGNQVKILGDSILTEAGFLSLTENIYKGEYIKNWVRENIKKVEDLKDDPFRLGQIAAVDILKAQIMPAVKKMGIKFNNWFSERNLIEKGEVEEAIASLKKMGLTKDEEGALWMKTTDYGDDKDRVLVKSDGDKTYFANDVAYHYDKFFKRDFDKVVNFWGADHHGYVGRMQAAVSAMGKSGAMDIVIMQMVRLIKDGQEYKMSKRKGSYITMDDLFDLIGGKKGDSSDVARFFFLSRSFNTHMDFDLDLAREHSEKNPVFYVKYAHARICGVLRKAKDLKLPESNHKLLIEKEEIDLVMEISKLPGIIESTLLMKDYPVHNLAFYSRELATKFHSFYDHCRVIDEGNPDLTAARLSLVSASKIVLGIVLSDLLGIDCPEKM